MRCGLYAIITVAGRIPPPHFTAEEKTEQALVNITAMPTRGNMSINLEDCRVSPSMRETRRPTVLLVPGLGNSPYNHWQSRWQRERNDCVRADLGRWHEPDPQHWIARLDECIRPCRPVVIVAHSLGCIATVLWANQKSTSSVGGALLVAPCDTEAGGACEQLKRFAPTIPSCRLPFPSLIVASSNDPYASLARSRDMAESWGAELINAGAAGHLNAASPLGSWSYGQALLNTLLTPLSKR
jgi:predicted alpha/beta hydrolase family esterase